MNTINKIQLQSAIEEILYGGSFHEYEFHDWGYEFLECNSCGWNSKKDRKENEGLKHHPNCYLKNAITLLEEFLEE